jgi:hypothetical protein
MDAVTAAPCPVTAGPAVVSRSEKPVKMPSLVRSCVWPAAVLVLGGVLAVAPLMAQTWAEAGDAGSLVITAQVTSGNGPFQVITGALAAHDDVDVYCFQLAAVPPQGQPLASIPCTMHAEPSLYVFDANGLGVDANMTCAGGTKTVAASGSMAPGLYYLAVAHGDYLPTSAGGAIWNLTYGNHLAPNGPGAASPLTGWTGPVSVAAPYPYQLNLWWNWVNWCELATADESTSWGSLKARYGS